MIRKIKIGNFIIQYDLQHKEVKNINLRIKPDGSISVSSSKRVPQKIIDDFIISKADFILRALEKYKNRPSVEQKQYYTEDEVKELILLICDKVYLYYEKREIKCPKIKFKKMVSRWGSCHSQKGVWTFNTNLMYAPIECIEYVVYHEFTHFLQPNHSIRFYDAITKVYPNWKECRNKLKTINLR